nr:MAG: ORF1 [TTV-like mini virus]
MPYWNRYYRSGWKLRRRRYWRRRSRRPFRSRFWRRRNYRVRKRKAKSIKIREYQPHYIRKLSIIGTYPVFLTTNARLTNNMTCYLESIAPHDYPGGGGFSICNFSLKMLYDENIIARNVWTRGNENMPLIRYRGVTITLYSQPEVDYLFYYHNAYPMQASYLTYLSTHPQIMLQTKHVKIMRCRKHTKNKKPYRKFYIRPPSQMQSKWYFQHDLATIPLLQTMTTVCSLDRAFLKADALSTTIGFTSLDTTEIENHNFTQQGTQHYMPQHNETIFLAVGATPGKPITNIQIGNLICLGQVDFNQPGTQIKHIPTTSATSTSEKLRVAMTQSGYQGNPFYKEALHPDTVIVKTIKTYEQLKSNYPSDTSPLQQQDFSYKKKYLIDCRYNPFADKGKDNKVYLLKVTTLQHSDDWNPPPEPELIWKDLPLWLLTWGYLDFQKKCGTQSQIDTNSVFVIYSPYITPQTNKFYVPLDFNFIHGFSPYEHEILEPSDHRYWHPKVRFQVETINKIGTTGPFTLKIPDRNSCEGHIKYRFHFKLGGEPAPMSVSIDPTKQPKYNIPSNFLQTNSLQSPTTPIEYYLWKFDERRGQLTKKATQRITKDIESEKTVLSITDPSTQCPTLWKEKTETSESSTEEEEQTSLETKLLHERRKQKLLRKRINLLLNRLTNIE